MTVSQLQFAAIQGEEIQYMVFQKATIQFLWQCTNIENKLCNRLQQYFQFFIDYTQKSRVYESILMEQHQQCAKKYPRYPQLLTQYPA